MPEVPGYRIAARLGEGRTGRVFRATALDGGKEVALRLPQPHLADQPDLVEALARTGAILTRLTHPNVVRVFKLEQPAGGLPVLVMELLGGRTLAALVAEAGRLAPKRAVELVRGLCRGLSAVHEAGLVHLDVRPANLVVEAQGGNERLVLIDFALARQPGSIAPALGTAAYGSPEQASGRPVDARADLYAVGLVLYEALSGAPPFRAQTTGGVVEQHLHAAPPPLVARGTPVDAALSQVVMRCLAKDPAERYASAAEVEAALAALALPDAPGPTLHVTPTRTPRETTSYLKKDDDDDRASLTRHETAELSVPGTVLGSYRLLELIGEGGMGRVYLAEHARLGRKVALKLLRSELGANAQLVSRFFAEARAVNRICHENIVEITDFIENEGGDNYYIMEFLPGQNLHEVAQRGLLSLERTLGIAVQVCSALTSVHDAGIIHRDLKPENVFLTERGGRRDYVKLLDFGIAKLVGAEEALPTHKTGAGTILGTPEYMSPEQGSGSPLDHRSDIYSLGIILYELITGKNPFPGQNFGEMLLKRIAGPPPAKPSRCPGADPRVPRELDELVMQCLATQPAARPQRISEVELRLREIAAAHAVELESFVARGARRPPNKLWAVGAIAVSVIAVGGALLLRAPRPAVIPVAQPQPVQIAPAVPTPTVEPTPVPPPQLEPTPEEPETTATTKTGHAHAKHKVRRLDGPDRRAVIDPFK